MKYVSIGNGSGMAMVDDEDFAKVSDFNWFRINDSGVGASTFFGGRNTTVYMHRLVMGVSIHDKIQVDHINRNQLDNKKSNLRLCNPQEQSFNRGPRKGRIYTHYKGVTWHKRSQKWYAQIMKSGVNKFVGMFDCDKEAAIAWNKAAMELHGDFAYQNKIP